MESFEKLLLGGLITTTVISSNVVFSHADKLGETQYNLTNNLNMRKGPGTDYISIGTLKKGSTVTPLEYSQDKLWAKIKYNNKYVWICTTYINQVENNIAESKLGNYKTKERLNLRKGPSTNKAIIITIPKESVIKVVDVSTDGKWAHISYNDETGWVSMSYISKIDDKEEEKPSDSTTYEDYITTSVVNIRKGPSTSYDILQSISKGVVIKPLAFDKNGDWIKFNFDNQEAWICKDYLKKVNEVDSSDENIEYDKYKALYNLNMRKGPSTSYSILKQIPKDGKFDFIKLSPDKKWANIKYNSTNGWVSYQYIKKVLNTDDVNDDTQIRKILYTSENVNLRYNSSANSNKICIIPKNSKVSFICYNTNKTWAKVTYNNNRGWISASYLKSNIPSYKIGTTVANLRLRKISNTSGKVLMTIPHGSNVKIYEENNGWLKVSYNEVIGYCSAKYVK